MNLYSEAFWHVFHVKPVVGKSSLEAVSTRFRTTASTLLAGALKTLYDTSLLKICVAFKTHV